MKIKLIKKATQQITHQQLWDEFKSNSKDLNTTAIDFLDAITNGQFVMVEEPKRTELINKVIQKYNTNKFAKSSSIRKIRMSKSQWRQIGKIAGWINESRDFLFDVDSFEFVESEKYANGREVWSLTYDYNKLRDNSLFTKLEMQFRYGSIEYAIALLKECDFKGLNIQIQQPLSIEQIAQKIYSDIEGFFNVIKESDEVYDTERQIERRDMDMIDDQRPGHYETDGPDYPTQQY